MVFILGINIPDQRLLKAALEGFYGIGPNVSARICAKLSVHDTATIGSLSTNKTNNLTEILSKMTIENDLRRKIRDDISRLKEIGTYRGRRHLQGLPVRGQRTRCNNTTAKKLNRLDRRG